MVLADSTGDDEREGPFATHEEAEQFAEKQKARYEEQPRQS